MILEITLEEENLNDSYINKNNFDDDTIPKLCVLICVSRQKFIDKNVLQTYYNRPIKVKIRI